MKGVLSLIKSFNKTSPLVSYEASTACFFKMPEEVQFSNSILSAINCLKTQRGWVWKGEYYNLPGDASSKEVVMYTSKGMLVIVHICSTGELKSIYPDNDYDVISNNVTTQS